MFKYGRAENVKRRLAQGGFNQVIAARANNIVPSQNAHTRHPALYEAIHARQSAMRSNARHRVKELRSARTRGEDPAISVLEEMAIYYPNDPVLIQDKRLNPREPTAPGLRHGTLDASAVTNVLRGTTVKGEFNHDKYKLMYPRGDRVPA